MARFNKLVADNDYGSLVLHAFTKSELRDAYLALRAFNVSIASIDDHVTRAELGAARMVFWQDILTRVYQEPEKPVPAEPVAVLLAKVLREDGIKISETWLKRIIKARKQYLGGAPFPTLDALENYAEQTYSSLHYASLEALGHHSATLDHIGSHIGKATGIANILRGLPHMASRKGSAAAVVLPLDICAHHGLKQEEVLRYGPEAKGLQDAVFEVAVRANDHLITAREMAKEARKEVDRDVFATYLPAIPTTLYLEKLQQRHFDPFDPKLQKRDWVLPYKSLAAMKKRKF
ncbi:hypothetical protein EX30DRAFT_346866 [Ascodesmis nigricans]|uniref:Terpenoid synthase n=1 Tax=Ascodesmis nigricans TaxID=341454 RepID=A0A4S2N4V4_9PEZI|nr:hypothetical protein EX30DRAFT_346866 [Ascodesmis nigricans]